MRTIQGVMIRRALVRGLLGRIVIYTLLFAAAVASARVLVGDQLSGFIADVTAPWMEVPAESADTYRLMGLQEGMLIDGMYQFRDLSEYHFVVSIIKGPIVWGCYILGLIVLGILSCSRAARTVDDLAAGIAQMAEGEGAPQLSADLKAAQLELDRLSEREAARERATQAAEARKNELVAYLAHDIKTPLTSIVGYLALLDEEPDLPTERRARFVATALDKARSLDGMMDEFFEIARYNLSAIPIERERIDASILVHQVADELYPQAAGRDVGIDVDAPEGTFAFIDPGKMARALSNIVRNAVAFADAGTSVKIGLSCDAGEVRITVSDRGREIAPSHLERIFERFYREDAARGTQRGGAGLGLAIAREIVEAHGGKVCAQSEQGTTTFTVTVPQALPDPME